MNIILVIFIIYNVAVVVFGIVMSKGSEKSGADFLLAGRKLPILLVLGTMFGTLVGVGSSMGSTALGYTMGLSGAIFLIGAGFSVLATGLLYSNMRRYNIASMAEEGAIYFGGNKIFRGFLSLIMSIAEVGWVAVVIVGAGTYIEWILGIPMIWSRILATIFFATYVIIGGYVAVVWTDLVQSLVIGVGFLLAAVLGVRSAGGWNAIQSSLSTEYFSIGGHFGLVAALGLFVNQLLAPMGLPAYRQRIYSSKSEKVAVRSFSFSAFLCFAFAFLPIILGMAAKTINPTIEKADFVFPFMITEVFSPILGALVISAGISAAASSGDSNAVSAVNLIINDLLPIVFNKKVKSDSVVSYSRIILIFIFIFALVMSLVAKGVIDIISMVGGTIMIPIAVTFLLGKLWKRVTWQGGIASLLCGAIVSIIVKNSSMITIWAGYTAIPALIASLLGGIIVSLITPVNTKSWEQVAAELEEGREYLNEHIS